MSDNQQKISLLENIKSIPKPVLGFIVVVIIVFLLFVTGVISIPSGDDDNLVQGKALRIGTGDIQPSFLITDANGNLSIFDPSGTSKLNNNWRIEGEMEADTIKSNLGITASGGLTSTTGTFSGLLSANGGMSGTTGTFSGLLSANGGVSGTTGTFSGLLSANAGINVNNSVNLLNPNANTHWIIHQPANNTHLIHIAPQTKNASGQLVPDFNKGLTLDNNGNVEIKGNLKVNGNLFTQGSITSIGNINTDGHVSYGGILYSPGWEINSKIDSNLRFFQNTPGTRAQRFAMLQNGTFETARVFNY